MVLKKQGKVEPLILIMPRFLKKQGKVGLLMWSDTYNDGQSF